MKTLIIVGGLGCAFGFFALLRSQDLPLAKFTIKVLKEDGEAISGIEVRGGFGLPYNSWKGGNQETGYSTKKHSNHLGLVSFEGRGTDPGSADVNVPGYYSTLAVVPQGRVESGRWQPWNPTVNLVLRPILNPVKMYAKRMHNIHVPADDLAVGFDMIIGDWVAPHGKGITPDFLYLRHHKEISGQDSDFHIEITFPNSGDGIQAFSVAEHAGCSFRSPRFAPEDGYRKSQKSYQIRRAGTATVGNLGSWNDRFFFLRTRTVLDDSGKVKSAHYSKVYGDINRFDYFFNPTPNDRNMEYGGNLMQDLKANEQPFGP